MKDLILSKLTSIWLVLGALTMATWILTESNQSGTLQTIEFVTMAIMAFAFIKVRIIILHFMEVADAVLPLRIFFEAWVVLVYLVIVVIYLFGGGI